MGGRKISPPPGFDLRTVEPIASHYTYWANPKPTLTNKRAWICISTDRRKYGYSLRLHSAPSYFLQIFCNRLRWSRGRVLAFNTQGRGFKPGRSRRIFEGEKILSTPSFGGEVKPSVLCRRFAAYKRSLNGVEVVISAKLPDNILAHGSHFHLWDLSRRGGRGGT